MDHGIVQQNLPQEAFPTKHHRQGFPAFQIPVQTSRVQQRYVAVFLPDIGLLSLVLAPNDYGFLSSCATQYSPRLLAERFSSVRWKEGSAEPIEPKGFAVVCSGGIACGNRGQ